jgi:hypothetical protein
MIYKIFDEIGELKKEFFLKKNSGKGKNGA